MFFMIIFYLLGILGFCWIIWNFLVKPILNDTGIEIEDIVTEYTKQRDKLRAKYNELEKSAQAAEEGLELAREIKYWENRIADVEKRMKEI